jgi:hypothetical protein
MEEERARRSLYLSPPIERASPSSTEGGGKVKCGRLSRKSGLGSDEDMRGAEGIMHESESVLVIAGRVTFTGAGDT